MLRQLNIQVTPIFGQFEELQPVVVGCYRGRRVLGSENQRPPQRLLPLDAGHPTEEKKRIPTSAPVATLFGTAPFHLLGAVTDGQRCRCPAWISTSAARLAGRNWPTWRAPALGLAPPRSLVGCGTRAALPVPDLRSEPCFSTDLVLPTIQHGIYLLSYCRWGIRLKNRMSWNGHDGQEQ